ncbi:MAG: metallophosphoesterase family protein [Candidatus Omnitrophica bacterium]|nr:metallophosphoesterase family protein [Candidatus Omnitrophota bacterium]
MRYAIFADIHSNREALLSVLQACRDSGARKLFCSGDVVGYGPDPKNCIDIIKSEDITCIAGNHDWAVAGKIAFDEFNTQAKSAVEWTTERLPVPYKEFLGGLPLSTECNDFVLTHGSLDYPQRFRYLDDIRDSADTFFLMAKNVCFIGHTHVPQVFAQKGRVIALTEGKKLYLDRKAKYIVNVGSVGQPRDNDPRAAFCIFDPDLMTVEIKRVSYDISACQGKMYIAGLPEFLIRRLAVGQ